MASGVNITMGDLNRLFPAHLMVDSGGAIQSAGPSLRHHLDADLAGADLLAEFEVVRPIRCAEVGKLLKHDQAFNLRHRRVVMLLLQGVVCQSGDMFHLLASHVPSVDANAATLRYRFSDFSPFDGAKELFLASQIRTGLLKDTQELVDRLKCEKSAAEAADRAKGEFLACMSHEIRTPLNGVLGLGALLAETELDQAQRDMLAGMQRCGVSLLETLNDIIDIAKMDAGHLHIDRSEFVLTELTEHVRSSYEITCAEKNIDLTVRLDDDLAATSFAGDAARIRQVLNNLVSNALKFTGQGRIEVTITATEAAPGEDARIAFAVRDTGIGISEDSQQRIFKPFTQADTGIHRQYGGTGLGLSICRRLCERMGGEIGVVSKLGAGSTFTFTIPLARPASTRADADEAAVRMSA